MASNRLYSNCVGGVNPELTNDILSGMYSALLSMIGKINRPEMLLFMAKKINLKNHMSNACT